jgi:hypothetical protein
MATEMASNGEYAAEVRRLTAEGIVGHSGRLRELLDYLAERGPDAVPATQAEIAQAVFRQSESDADDATVRVYVHRLRKKLEDHYRRHPPAPGQAELEIPAGVYALRQIEEDEEIVGAASSKGGAWSIPRAWVIWAALALFAAFLSGFLLDRGNGASSNPIWDPLIASDRPILLVLGDYYLFGEIDPVFPEQGRLIRDFRVNSPEDLLVMQEAEPERYGYAEDFGLNYLPFQSSYALQQLAPILAGAGKEAEIIPSSQLTSDMLNSHDVVYIGLLSGMGLLEEITFADSSLRLGESYDELIDRDSGERWASDEARRLASPAFYRDYAYVTRYSAPGGAQVTVLASERITGLRGIGPLVASGDLPEGLDGVADEPFEALFQITGQQGADLSDRLILARPRE